MHLVFFTNGLLLIGMSAVMAAIALLLPDMRPVFMEAAVLTALVGVSLAAALARPPGGFRRVHTFLLTASLWAVATLAGALPLWLWNLSLTDAVFESVSGITTTGSTVMTGLDATPRGILVWRALLQWLGGIGFVVTGIAFLPIMRVGGMQFFRTESSQREEGEMVAAARFAGSTVTVYAGLTAACALAYLGGGMSGFDALCHALTTVSTGGYSTYDASFGHFTSPALQWTAVLFMLCGALPFAWYIRILNRGDTRNEQVTWFLWSLLIVIGLLTLWRLATGSGALEPTLRDVAFGVVSVVTTTGFATADYLTWGTLPIAVFFFLTVVGGCTGSTSGGVKAMRWMVTIRAVRSQIRTMRTPDAVRVVRYSGKRLGGDVLDGVAAFFMLYALTVFGIGFGLALYGLDMETAISGAATAVANVGPGIGPIIGPSGNFATLPDGAKWLLGFGMYLGRLEMFTVLVLLSPDLWREVV